MLELPLFPTTLVGSYPQPDWLIDRARLAGRFPPRVRARELWRPAEELPGRGPGRRDAARDPGAGGRRARHRHRRRDPPGELLQPLRHRARRRRHRPPRRGARPQRPPEPGPAGRRTDPPARARSSVRTWSSCGRTPTGSTKVTVPGPFTMSQQAQDDFYGDPRSMALAYAEACNQEVKDLFAAGADIVQIDEPYMQARPEPARAVRPGGAQPGPRRRGRHDGRAHLLRLRRDHPRAAVGLLVPARAGGLLVRPGVDRDRAVRPGPLGARPSCRQDDPARRARPVDPEVEPPEVVAERVRRALPYVDAERVVLAPDCGMKYLPRESAEASCAAWSRPRSCCVTSSAEGVRRAASPGSVPNQANDRRRTPP